MKFYVYILRPLQKTGVFYKGQTNDVTARLSRHNQGKEKYTSKGRPWALLWFFEKETRSEALILESIGVMDRGKANG